MKIMTDHQLTIGVLICILIALAAILGMYLLRPDTHDRRAQRRRRRERRQARRYAR